MLRTWFQISSFLLLQYAPFWFSAKTWVESWSQQKTRSSTTGPRCTLHFEAPVLVFVGIFLDHEAYAPLERRRTSRLREDEHLYWAVAKLAVHRLNVPDPSARNPLRIVHESAWCFAFLGIGISRTRHFVSTTEPAASHWKKKMKNWKVVLGCQILGRSKRQVWSGADCRSCYLGVWQLG